MDYQFTSDKPIYLQLMDAFKIAIVSGELPQGSRLDSVRDLAVEAHVNPNTMQKALSELERLGLIRTERTSGRFITDDQTLINSMRREMAEKEVLTFLAKMDALNLNREDALALIEKANGDN